MRRLLLPISLLATLLFPLGSFAQDSPTQIPLKAFREPTPTHTIQAAGMPISLLMSDFRAVFDTSLAAEVKTWYGTTPDFEGQAIFTTVHSETAGVIVLPSEVITFLPNGQVVISDKTPGHCATRPSREAYQQKTTVKAATPTEIAVGFFYSAKFRSRVTGQSSAVWALLANIRDFINTQLIASGLPQISIRTVGHQPIPYNESNPASSGLNYFSHQNKYFRALRQKNKADVMVAFTIFPEVDWAGVACQQGPHADPTCAYAHVNGAHWFAGHTSIHDDSP